MSKNVFKDSQPQKTVKLVQEPRSAEELCEQLNALIQQPEWKIETAYRFINLLINSDKQFQLNVQQQDKVVQAIINCPIKYRALNVLFMATSPQGIEPVLDFEAEEGRILEATKRIPLSLTVEESGCLSELGYSIQEYEQGYFDIFHLTGYATFKDEKPCFITETELGEPEYSSAEDIAEQLN
ncbi:hypothetical protein WA1_48145 [Scytonema hofmannii PCC 7110]|uniref:Uncharacterized protein n=1 Tax=Scytonema hofmannii PCC 7110 TaxID=128403 RepID=A0A139WY66_9CYAN|nr:hypothetical protein [Scytonema hofmannii]KYC37384.1 hypothetical protein WA1_48145 [Scytonema hofmannii PCC 7110]